MKKSVWNENRYDQIKDKKEFLLKVFDFQYRVMVLLLEWKDFNLNQIFVST